MQGTGYNTTAGRVTGNTDGYTTPDDGNASGTYDFQEATTTPSITTQPVDDKVFPGGNTTFEVVASSADTYQWQQLISGTWTDITDSGIQSGTNTATLTVLVVGMDKNGYNYGVDVFSSATLCASIISIAALLTVRMSTVITDRRITFRVKKD